MANANQPNNSAAATKDEARTLGRGFLFILFAKAYFMVMGFAVQFGLPRLFLKAAKGLVRAGNYTGMAASRIAEVLYGDYGVAVRTVSWVNNTMVQGTIQAVSKYVAEDTRRAYAVKAIALRLQALVGATLAAAYFLLADAGAALLNDPGLARYFRITAIIILAYAIYAVFIGYLNGLKKFHIQAGFDVGYSTIKTFLMLGAAALGFGVTEVLAGFSGASVIICALAALIVAIGDKRAETAGLLRRENDFHFSWNTLLKGMGLVVSYFIIFNFLLTADLWIVKALAARVEGVTPARAAALSSALVGLYTGVQAVAFVPYQAVLAVAFVIFPVVSKSTFEQDHQATRNYVQATLRYALIFVALLVSILAASPKGILGLVKPSFVTGASALRIYLLGEIFFALFAVSNTIIIASGRMKTAIALAATTLAIDVTANLVVVPQFLQLTTSVEGDMYISSSAIEASAAASAGSFLIGLTAAFFVLWRNFGARLPLSSSFRVALSTMITIFVVDFLLSQIIPTGVLYTLVRCIAAGLTFSTVLLLTREFDTEDRKRLSRVLGRG